VLLVELGHVRDAAERHPRMQRLADLLDMGAATSAARCASRCRRSPSAHRPSGRSRTSRRLAAESGGWPELVEAYEAAVPRPRRPRRSTRSSRCWARWRPPTSASSRTPELAIARNQKILSISAKEPDAVAALERLYIATGRFADLLAIYDKKLEMAKSKPEELEIRFKLASLYDEEIKQPDKAIELYLAIIAQDPEQLPALSALDRLYQQLSRWKDLAETISKEIDLSTDLAAVAELKFRRGAVLEQYLEDGAGRRGVVPRGARDRLVARGRAHRAAGISVEQRRRAAARGRQGAGADLRGEQRHRPAWSKSSASSWRTRRRPTSASTCCCGSASWKDSSGNTDQAWEAYTRAVAESPGVAAAREALEKPGQHPRQLAAAGGAVREGAVGQGQGEAAVRARARAAARSSRSRTTRSWSSPIAPSSTSGAPRASSPRTRRRWSRSNGCTRAPSAGAIWSTRCSRRRSSSPTPPSARRSGSAPRGCGKRCWATPSRRSSPGTSSCRTTPATCRRCAPSIVST
jgi:tetratricopeptide (TPR) repeat protein